MVCKCTHSSGVESYSPLSQVALEWSTDNQLQDLALCVNVPTAKQVLVLFSTFLHLLNQTFLVCVGVALTFTFDISDTSVTLTVRNGGHFNTSSPTMLMVFPL